MKRMATPPWDDEQLDLSWRDYARILAASIVVAVVALVLLALLSLAGPA